MGIRKLVGKRTKIMTILGGAIGIFGKPIAIALDIPVEVVTKTLVGVYSAVGWFFLDKFNRKDD